MIQKLVALALRMPAIVGVLAVCALLGGLYCYKNLDIEAYPNPVAPMIEVLTAPERISTPTNTTKIRKPSRSM